MAFAVCERMSQLLPEFNTSNPRTLGQVGSPSAQCLSNVLKQVGGTFESH